MYELPKDETQNKDFGWWQDVKNKELEDKIDKITTEFLNLLYKGEWPND